MANTVTLLSYANTFGDWVVTTNDLVKENNDLAANNYIKPTGTLYLNSPSLGLQVASRAIVAGEFQVQGLGSSAYVQNNLTVGNQVYFSNTILGLTNTGQANIGGILLALASGTGLAVSNNATVGGSLSVANTLSVTRQTALGNTLSVVGAATLSNTLSVYGDTTVTGATTLQSTLSVTNNANLGNNLTVAETTTTRNLTVNEVLTANAINVQGNFTINGTTVYNTPSFTIGAATPNINGFFNVYRSPGANASIKWDQANTYWSIADVSSNSYFYRIITTQQLSDSVNTVSSVTAATSTAANVLNNTIITANTNMKSYVDVANTSLKSYVDTTIQNQITANTNLQTGINLTQNTNITSVNQYAATAYAQANVTVGVDATQNTNITSVNQYAATAYAQANVTIGVDATQNTRIQSNETVNNNQNTSISIIQGVDLTQNTTITAVNNYAASAYASSNTKVASITGTGNQIIVSGTTTPTLSLPQSIHTAGAPTFAGVQTTSQINAQGNQTGSVLNATASLGGIMVQGPGTTNGAYISFHRPGVYAAYFGLDSDSQFAVGGWSAGAGLAPMKVGSFGVGTAATGTAGEIRATNNITSYYSDDRLKNKLGNIQNALESVKTLNGFYYEANQTAQDLGYTVKREVGMSAQEVQKILPEIVVPAPIDDKYLTIHYERIIPLLVEAIKELSAEVEKLKK